jgi:hypothetical protein
MFNRQLRRDLQQATDALTALRRDHTDLLRRYERDTQELLLRIDLALAERGLEAFWTDPVPARTIPAVPAMMSLRPISEPARGKKKNSACRNE